MVARSGHQHAASHPIASDALPTQVCRIVRAEMDPGGAVGGLTIFCRRSMARPARSVIVTVL